MAQTIGEEAVKYATVYNWPIFPLIPGQKEPLGRLAPHGFQSAVVKQSTVEKWWEEEPQAGIGAATGPVSGIFVVDADIKKKAGGDVSWKRWIEEYGDIPLTPTAETPSGGRHYYFQYPTDIDVSSSVGTVAKGIDVRGKGGYVVLPPSSEYKWLINPATVPPALAPAWLLKRLIDAQKRAPSPVNTDEDIIVEGVRNATLTTIAGRLRRGGFSTREIYSSLLTMNKQRCKPPLPSVDVRRIAVSNARYPANANAHQQVQALNSDEKRLVGHLRSIFGELPTLPLSTVVDALRSEEEGDARLAISLHGDQLLFYAPEKTWYVFDGLHWKAFPQKTIRQAIIGRVARMYARTADMCMEEVTKGNTTNRNVADAMLKRAANLLHVRKQRDILDNIEGALTRNDDKRNPATYIQWDADPDLFAVQNGVIDLRTGELRPTSSTDYIRTVVPVEWEGITARCPEWLRFIRHVHSDDTEIVRFMQRLFGYAITGHARDHYITIMYGSLGRNGKGVILEVIGSLMGDYALAVSKNILIDTGRKATPSTATPHLAQLRGKRLVWCSETKEDERADAGILKYLSGEDTVNARDLYESGGHTFTPTHTLFLATNYRPHLPASDEATWERIIIVEYMRRYLDDPNPANPVEFARDPLLKERLMRELPGILAWLVRGSMRWHQDGLQRPQKTRHATKEYRKVEDWGIRWLEARCVLEPTAITPSRFLYEDFVAWWDRGDRAPSQTAFGRRLAELGFPSKQDPTTSRMVRHGLRIATIAATLDQPIDFSRIEN